MFSSSCGHSHYFCISILSVLSIMFIFRVFYDLVCRSSHVSIVMLIFGIVVVVVIIFGCRFTCVLDSQHVSLKQIPLHVHMFNFFRAIPAICLAVIVDFVIDVVVVVIVLSGLLLVWKVSCGGRAN